MSKQAELDRIYKRIADEYHALNAKQVAYAIREVGRVRAEVAELLTEFAADDGTIKRQRLSRLLRELDGVERDLRKYGTAAIDEIIEKSASFTTSAVSAGFATVAGVPLITGSFERLNREVVNYVTRRFGEDGLVLSDRIWGTSGDIRDAIGASLRSDIIRGESVGKMVANVRKAYDNETWKIKRLVVTEGNTAYRTASALSAQRSEVVSWVKLNDNGSRHKNHESHRCYVLAREDRYGEGAGVFKPTDSEIYMPHPNCSSFITAVLDKRYL
ncbi:hypothetical protein MHZ92_14325 [Sporosarcina sp. ACRSL]|uniref:hypothetical protein n=1 Tax=Sporosarcina sp. ACRSL TaxID=2918215 RepID=UPI001EF6BD84|nr:hypothetical protein [Sporosarcina sp. ACRSL]MCG7345312.1 hypothetical protein [Sporosarcina sp. ACRSL]